MSEGKIPCAHKTKEVFQQRRKTDMDRAHQVTVLLGHLSMPQFFCLLIANIFDPWIHQPLKCVEGPPTKASLATIFPQIVASVTFHLSIYFSIDVSVANLLSYCSVVL